MGVMPPCLGCVVLAPFDVALSKFDANGVVGLTLSSEIPMPIVSLCGVIKSEVGNTSFCVHGNGNMAGVWCFAKD